MLEKRGHSVATASDGVEAVVALQKQPFDVVLMDVQMQKMDGFEATGVIRTEEKATGDHVPIIALTGYAMQGDRERFLAAGMDDYLAKPIDPSVLFEAGESIALA